MRDNHAFRPRILLLLLLTTLALGLVPSTVQHVHGAGVTGMSIDPSSQALAAPGSTVTFGVNVTNAVRLSGWDVQVQVHSAGNPSDPTQFVEKPLFADSINVGPFLSQPQVQIDCINGVGTGCGGDDRPGIIHSEVISAAPVSGNGTLFTITFTASSGPPDYTFVTIIKSNIVDDQGNFIPVSVSNGQYGNVPNDLPVAIFTYKSLEHAIPIDGDTIVFNGTSSYDPLGSAITDYFWTFQNPSSNKAFSSTSAPNNNNRICIPIPDFHFYQTISSCTQHGIMDAGNWTVSLTVTNSLGVESRQNSTLVVVLPLKVIDLAIAAVVSNGGPQNSPDNILPGTVLFIVPYVLNSGTVPEANYNVTAKVVGGGRSLFLGTQMISQNITQTQEATASFRWDTAGWKPNSYIIEAWVDPIKLQVYQGENLTETNTANNNSSLTVRLIYPYLNGATLALSIPQLIGAGALTLAGTGAAVSLYSRRQAARRRAVEDAL